MVILLLPPPEPPLLYLPPAHVAAGGCPSASRGRALGWSGGARGAGALLGCWGHGRSVLRLLGKAPLAAEWGDQALHSVPQFPVL